MTAKVICITNQKGGVGKSTSRNLRIARASSERKAVVLIDLDPQGQAAVGFGYDARTRRVLAVSLLANRPNNKKIIRQWL